ncbi:hypothetical protein [Streptomyces sp. NBC_01197]|uniref:hypothetical protein n=1 Tax=Streptomyces sp. NBC_01197 TaxID=2903768 RepID=UPI002E10D01C|nr:hypothetical protein OG452_05315 [Streptomyces sp. NBC_01197]
MSEENTTETTATVGTETGQQGTGTQPTVEELIAERDKWKTLSRTNEDRWKEASQERDQLKQSGMTDQEKALEAARAEGRTSAYSEVGSRLVESELKAAAATNGVQLPDLKFVNTSQFVDANGLPVSDQINAFVTSLPKPATGSEFAQDLGLGRQGGAIGPDQLSHADLSNMTPTEINKARVDGRLDALMRGDL